MVKRFGFIILGIIFLPLLWLQSFRPINVTLYVGVIIGYGFLLFFLRIITPTEVGTLQRIFRSREWAIHLINKKA
jgi:hypothetical protein